ncbi:ATP-dependent DNA helicase [Trichonephila clavata]|uniref:ATP-dependent DNA helicase n=1 Tax=Trichonephila clavata TaxID=2740835 RepID=A0A8X6FJY4_TRICU|nr:ATP-dependent DNA helicase [Trichonephila clavata]
MLEDVDNSWVVPYSPLLCRIFKAHINVEYCNSVKSIKYICKYVTKGSDAAMFAVANEMPNRLDEVTTYQQGRYISSNEAVWRLLNFSIHQRYPTVVHLAVHLEGAKEDSLEDYEPGQPTANLTDTPPKTTLTAFFFISAKQTLLQKHCCILKCLDIFAEMPVKRSGKSEKKVYLLQTFRDM